MEQENKQMNSLPDNAYRELAPGEEYKPMMPANFVEDYFNMEE